MAIRLLSLMIPCTFFAVAQAPPRAQPAPHTGGLAPIGRLSLQNAPLVDVIDLLARQLRINYVLDPRVNRAVFINTFGENQDVDARNLLDLILRANGAGLVEAHDTVFRVVPLNDISNRSFGPQVNTDNRPAADETVLNLVFLEHMPADEILQHLLQLTSEHATVIPYAPASLLVIASRAPAIR